MSSASDVSVAEVVVDTAITADACGVRVVDPAKVAVVTAALPDREVIAELAQVFGLLADPGRLRVITALLEGGEMCVCDIAAACGHSESGVSHSLRLLRASRVVRVRRSGRRAYYRLDDSHVRMLLDLALAHVGHRHDDQRPPEALEGPEDLEEAE